MVKIRWKAGRAMRLPCGFSLPPPHLDVLELMFFVDPVTPYKVTANFEGGCPNGSRLGLLCRPPSGWQPHLDGIGAGYLFLADSRAQVSTRTINLADGSIGVSFLFFRHGEFEEVLGRRSVCVSFDDL